MYWRKNKRIKAIFCLFICLQRSIGSDSQGRATAANNKRQLNENKKPFNFLSLQINTNKSKDPASGSQKKESGVSVQCKELFGAALSKDFLQNCQVSAQEDGRGETAMDSSQVFTYPRMSTEY